MHSSTAEPRSVQKVCRILSELTNPGPHRLSNIVANTRLNKATVLRLLAALRAGQALLAGQRSAGDGRRDRGPLAFSAMRASQRAAAGRGVRGFRLPVHSLR